MLTAENLSWYKDDEVSKGVGLAQTLSLAWQGLDRPAGGFTNPIKDPWVKLARKDQGQAILGAHRGLAEKVAWQDWGAWAEHPKEDG